MKDSTNIHDAEQQMYCTLISLREDLRLEKKLQKQAKAKEAMINWANNISYSYSMAVYSFNTARYEDVKSDVKRCRLSNEDVKIILSKMVATEALDLIIAQIWYKRITGLEM